MVKGRQGICWVNMQSGPDGTCTQSGFHYRREILNLGNPNLLWWGIRLDFCSKGRLIFQGCILYQCLWKDKSGTKSCQCLSHMMCKLTRDPRRTVVHGCLKVTKLVNIRAKTGTKVAKVTEMVSLVPWDIRLKFLPTHGTSPHRTWGVFAAGLAHMRHPSSRTGLLLCSLEPGPNLGLHSCDVSCFVRHGRHVCLGSQPSSTASGIPLPFPMLGQHHAWLWVSSTPLCFVQLSQLQEFLTVTCPRRALSSHSR